MGGKKNFSCESFSIIDGLPLLVLLDSQTCALWLWGKLYHILAADLTQIEHSALDPHNTVSKQVHN